MTIEYVLKRDDAKYFTFAARPRDYKIGDVTDSIDLALRYANELGALFIIEMLPDPECWSIVPVRVTVEEVSVDER